MYRTVMFPNYLFIRANIMAGASIIVYIEAKINNNNNVGCAENKTIMARFNSNLKVFI